MSCCGQQVSDLDRTIKIAGDLAAQDGISRAVYILDAQYFIEKADTAIERGYKVIQILQ